VLALYGSWFDMALVHGPFFLRARPCHYTTAPSIITYMVVHNCILSNYRTVDIRIMDNGAVNIDHSGIVPEPIT
jgi:hypothetical protein